MNLKCIKALLKLSTVVILVFSLVACGISASDSMISEEQPASEKTSPLEEQEVLEEQVVSEENTASEAMSEISAHPEWTYDITIGFAGDVNLAEDYGTTDLLDAGAGDISTCIDQSLIDIMMGCDAMVLNNEFAYSDRGTPMEGKAYTFRASPDRVKVLQDLGVDAVYLANNHVYDYGEDACLDTFDTLDSAGIKFFGAGRNIDEASAPLYLDIQGKTIALCAASRAEKNKMTPQATENEPGILRCYDTELFDAELNEASSKADFTIAVVHWGTEYSTELEQVQVDTAKEYIEAGADAVIGAHTHCLQGLDYIEGTPVVYSLGNYWFNEKTLDTEIALLHIYGNEDEQHIKVQIIPGVQEEWHTRGVKDQSEARRIFDDLENMSENIKIDSEGYVTSVIYKNLIEELPEVNFDVDYPVGQITAGVTVSQKFISVTDQINSISLYGATYTRDNTATVNVELLNQEEQIIATWVIDSSLMQDNQIILLPVGEYGETVDKCVMSTTCDEKINRDLKGKELMIRISSPDGQPDLSPTFWMAEENIYADGCLNVAGYDQYNDLWFQVEGIDEIG